MPLELVKCGTTNLNYTNEAEVLTKRVDKAYCVSPNSKKEL